jgi:hypothetical protein
MRYLRITRRDPEGTLVTDQVPVSRILGYVYERPADESARPSRLTLALDGPSVPYHFPVLFEGSEADEVAKALRLHRPPMRDEVAFGALLTADDRSSPD